MSEEQSGSDGITESSPPQGDRTTSTAEVSTMESVSDPPDIENVVLDVVPAPETSSASRPGTSNADKVNEIRPGTSGGQRPRTGTRPSTAETRPGTGVRPGTAGPPLAPPIPEGQSPLQGSEANNGENGATQNRLKQLQTAAVAQAVVVRKGAFRAALFLNNTTLGVIIHRSDAFFSAIMSHGTRYFIFMVLLQLFPIAYALSRVDATRAQACNQPVEAYFTGTVVFSSARVLVAFGVRRRMDNRNWVGQTFNESLGSIWNLQDAEDQGQTNDDGCLDGIRLNILIFIVVLGDFFWWFVGFFMMCANDPVVCADRVLIDGWVMVMYQLFNVFGASMVLDVALPYFYLEWDPDVDHVSKVVKKSSSDRKREMKRLAERTKERAAREAEKKKENPAKPRVIQVEPAAGARGARGGSGGRVAAKPPLGGKANDGSDGAWWASGSGVPPRKRDFAVPVGSSKVAPALPES